MNGVAIESFEATWILKFPRLSVKEIHVPVIEETGFLLRIPFSDVFN